MRKLSETTIAVPGMVVHRVVFWVLGTLLFAQSSALPIHIGFVFVRPDSAVVTEGCKKKTCCTALCYVDKHGVHHCVHGPGESCECGLSKNEVERNPILLATVVTFPEAPDFLPAFVPTGWIMQTSHPIATLYPSTPKPPPK